jgi:hypothetical protein
MGTNFISELEVPYAFSEWQGRDVTKQLNINTADTNFNFINEAFANQYINSKGKNLLFIILDAGNFHHPKVCFTGAGYKIKELPDTEFHTPKRSFKAIVIDKKIAHEWIEQKFKQLYFSMINKKRIGLMVRLDIPAKEADIEDAMILAKQFVNDLSLTLQPEQAGYILGEK